MSQVYHVMYINLDKDVERKEKTLANIRLYFENRATIERIAGIEPDPEDALYLADKNYDRPMTLGEVGCAMSHIRAWTRVMEMNRPCIILEDDVYSNDHNFLEKLSALESNTALMYKPEFVYLGRQAHSEGNEIYMSRELCIPKFSWLLHAYWLTPEGARKLLSTRFTSHVGVVDDYVPIMLGNGPDLKYAKQFEDAEKLRSLAFRKPLFYQTHTIGATRTMQSRTENSPIVGEAEDQFGLVTIATDVNRAGFVLHEKSMQMNGFVYRSNAGSESDWTSNMSKPDGIQKLWLMREKVTKMMREGVRNDAIICYVDGYDVYSQNSPADVVQTFKKLQAKPNSIIFGCERNWWPPNREETRRDWEEKYGNWYLNSGCYIGRLGDIAQMLFSESLEAELTDVDDQAWFQNVALKQDNVQLDVTQELFLNLAGEMNVWVHPNMRYKHIVYIKNGDLLTAPCFVHGNGGWDMKDRWKEMAEKFIGYEEPKEIDFKWIGPKKDIH